MTHRCGGCETTWTGFSQCHCARCHQTFSTLAHFDKHLAHDADTCKSPVRMGLKQNEFGIWRAPNEHYNFEKGAE